MVSTGPWAHLRAAVGRARAAAAELASPRELEMIAEGLARIAEDDPSAPERRPITWRMRQVIASR